MKGAFGRADGDVLAGVERAAHTGRRITARRARRQKRAHAGPRRWSVGPLRAAPAIALGIAILVLAGAAAAVALSGTHTARKKTLSATTVRPVAPSSQPPTTAVLTTGVYIRYADAAATVHYMYCTNAAGCGLLDVAKDGTSTIAVASLVGVWHREERQVITHDPCINIIRNGVPIGKPGDFVSTRTTDLHRVGTQAIKGIAVPARIAGTIVVRFEHPDVPGCTFNGSPGFTQRVDSPVTEYVPAKP